MNEALLVRFHTDDSIVSKGFTAAFEAFDENDGRISAEEEDEEDNEGNTWRE